MIESLLIANRGEIARRIIRTARALSVRTIAVHSDVDAEMPFVREADEAVMIGPAPARASYLHGTKILEAARMTGAAAIHPGYGFLSENAEFAQAVQAAGLVWVGAPPAAIRAMGLKDAAKRLMQQAGVPVTPGYLGDDQAADCMQKEADKIGYPVLIKAVAGGGGKGMRKVSEAKAFAEALVSCRREASAAFGDDRVLLEKYINAPRHIEVQVFGDSHGNVVHLFERDCSLQRRHQKVIEEAPAPGMDEVTRHALCAVAVKAARAVNYVGAGTVEFISDASQGLRADRIWFMEMNTRLQVEHPVTEAITGQDLVEWQLRVASGEPLPMRQSELSISGWAMEARLYAENPANGFLPSIGKLDHLRFPADIRVDSGVEEGDEISPHYDPLIAKLIVHTDSRTAAAAKLAKACGQVEAWPVKTNAGFLMRAACHADFRAGQINTGFIERHGAQLIPGSQPDVAVQHTAARALVPDQTDDPWTALPGFRIAAPSHCEVGVQIGGVTYSISIDPTTKTVGTVATMIGGERVLFADGEAWSFGPPRADRIAGGAATNDGQLLSPMPGRVIAIDVAQGDKVKKGQRLIVIEAMKMEHGLNAPFDGIITELNAVADAQIAEGALLVRVEKGDR
jgi:3-methylcrotonyl-CoA carboxylase alpha subunit